MRNLRDQLAVLFVLLMLMESDCSRHRCPPVRHVNRSKNHCETDFSKVHLTCSGGLHGEWKTGSEDVRILTLCGWPEESFDPEEISKKFPTLQNLSIFYSNLTYFTSPFPSTAKHLQNIRLNGTKLERLSDDAFSMLPSLRVLDLRHNALSFVSSSALEGPPLEVVYLSDNPWKCSLEMSWILKLNNDSVASRVVDRDKMICYSRNYNRLLVPVVEVLRELDIQCPKNSCSCDLSYVGRSPGASQLELMVFVAVNCSSRNLTEMPEFLPKNTTTLYLSENQIHDLSPLKENPIYKHVQDVYLDNNVIESIAILEGSDWLDHFRALSLRGNLLTDLPPYALENALQQNHGAASVFLGKNPWRCDCHFTPGFQDLLSRHTSLFKDVREITCSKIEDDENSDKPIMELTRTAICTPPGDGYWIQPLDILNVVLASLIFFVFGKLLYDYWTFKRTGKLPWIVAKIP